LGWSHTCCGDSAELNDHYRLASKNATAPGLTTLAAEITSEAVVVVTLVVALVALVVSFYTRAECWQVETITNHVAIYKDSSVIKTFLPFRSC